MLSKKRKISMVKNFEIFRLKGMIANLSQFIVVNDEDKIYLECTLRWLNVLVKNRKRKD